MPSIRRRPESTQVYSENDDDEDSQGPSKRIRLSTDDAPTSDADSESYLEGTTSASVSVRHQANTIGTQQAFESLQNEPEDEEDDKRREQRERENLEKEKDRYVGNQERDNGIIESVECQNFMCHEHLSITLGPLINFIVGHNGSGKSAVLTAITLCLGGKATSTNRGQNLKSFVKEGKENCVLKVKIKNQGTSGYRADVYGESIIVERHFSTHGSSSFKLKAASGRIISTKRIELDEITDYYALQLDNPVNVLTQDQARQFLNASTAQDKYKFFVRGVQLEQLNTDYNIVFENLQRTGAMLPDVADALEVKRTQRDEARKKHQRTKEQQGLRDKQNKITRQWAWAQVEGVERQAEDAEAAVTTAQRRIETTEAEAEAKSEAYDRRDEAHENAHKHAGQVEEEKAPVEEARNALQATFDKIEAEVETFVVEQRKIKGSLKLAQNKRKELDKAVEEERARLAAMNDGNHATLIGQVDEAEKSLASVKEELEQHPALKTPLENARNTADLREADIRRASHEKQQQFDAANNRLRQLQHGDTDPMHAYHKSLRGLLRMIEAERRWRQKPVGPIGMHVKLNQPQWSPLLEKSFGAMLNNFVVSYREDQNLLLAMIKKSGYICSVMMGSGAHIDTSAHEAERGLNTVSRALTVENDLVRNQLIINQRIEQVLLIESRTEALNFTKNKPTWRGQIICFKDNDRQNGHIISSKGGSMSMDPLSRDRNNQNRAPRMMTDNASQIHLQQITVQSARVELQRAQTESTEATNRCLRCKQALEAHERRSKELRLQDQQLTSRIDELKQELDTATAAESPLDGFKEQQIEAMQEEEQLQLQYQGSSETHGELTQQRTAHKQALDNANRGIEDHQKKIDKAASALRKAKEKRETALREKNEGLAVVEDTKKGKTEAEENLQRLTQQVSDFIDEATKVSQRVPVPHGATEVTLELDFKAVEKELQRAQREIGGDSEQISRAATAAEKAFKEASRYYSQLVKLRVSLLMAVDERSKQWVRFRSAIAARARASFQYLLAERGFHGRLIFEHKLRELELKVQPDPKLAATTSASGAGSSAAGRQTKTLSGGEKSFSTICLLLALWDAMGSPIRCLDEFDVFMDSVNRDQSMKMMVQAARRSVGRQFILITPQSMGAVKGGDRDIRIHMMREPERGQTALRLEG